jgi:hypothetical protein
MATSILYTAPAGIAGAITRVDDTTVEPGFLAAANGPTLFGQPVKVEAGTGKFLLMGLTSVAADFYGILIREVPSIGNSTTLQGLADGGPNLSTAHGIAVRGYMNVVCPQGTPVRGGAVYVRVVDGGAGKAVGQFEAVADGANSVLIPSLSWAVNGKEASTNIAEIRVNKQA